MVFSNKFAVFVEKKKSLSGFIHVREMSGKFKFFQGQGIVREFCDVSGKNEILQKNVREMSVNFTFQPDEAGMFGPDVSFFAKFIKFSAPILEI